MMKTSVKLLSILVVVVCVSSSVIAVQPGPSLEDRLEEMAASRPEVARLLDDLAAEREAQTYDAEGFGKRVQVEMTAFQIAPGGKYVMQSTGAMCRGTPNSQLGNAMECIDRATGKSEEMMYDAKISYSPEGGLSVEMTTKVGDDPPRVSNHVFENFTPITIVAKEMADGSRYVVRLLPVLEPKTRVVDYASDLSISLKSAILLRDGELMGSYSCSGGIVGILSGKAAMRFDFGLKTFPDAKPIGQTDGRTIWFEYEGHKYELHNAAGELPIPVNSDVQWKVFVRARPGSKDGDGTSSSTYDSLLLSELLSEKLDH